MDESGRLLKLQLTQRSVRARELFNETSDGRIALVPYIHPDPRRQEKSWWVGPDTLGNDTHNLSLQTRWQCLPERLIGYVGITCGPLMVNFPCEPACKIGSDADLVQFWHG